MMSSIFNELKRRNVVRVGVAYGIVGWLLIQLAGALEPALLLPDWVDRVVTVFVIIGFPIVLLFAWAFEMTPDGLKLTSHVDPEQSITRVTGKKLEHTTIVLLGIVVVFFVVREFMPSSDGDDVTATDASQSASIAVLPFEDYSEDKDQDFFSKGISEEILNLLAKTNALRVAARTSSFAFSGSELDIRDIGTKLDVETVLEGSIRKSGPNIRITAQLINVEDGYHLWSETYDRAYADIFRIQDEIAAEILEALKVHLLGSDVAPTHVATETTVDMDAYNAYLIGKERMALRTQEDIEAARELFLQAQDLDPMFAPAHVSLAHVNLLLERYEFGGDGLVDDDHDAEIRGHLETALELAPDLPDALAVSGYYHLQRNRYEEAEEHLDRALRLNPNHALAYMWRAGIASEDARYLDMLADKEKAYALDPMSLEISADLAYQYRSFWRPQDAERVIERMFALHPDHALAYSAALDNLRAHGRLGEALLMADEGIAANPKDRSLNDWRAWLLVQTGLFDEAIATEVPFAVYYALMGQGRHVEARVVLDQELAGEDGAWWHLDVLQHLREAGDGPANPEFDEHLDKHIAQLEKRNIEWRSSCDLALIEALRDAGRQDDTTGMMEQCHLRYEERLKVQYLCPCSFYGLVRYTILDGRLDQAVQRTEQWLGNGDSTSLLPRDQLFTQLKDRPEYEELLARNEAQLERQREIYLASRKETTSDLSAAR